MVSNSIQRNFPTILMASQCTVYCILISWLNIAHGVASVNNLGFDHRQSSIDTCHLQLHSNRLRDGYFITIINPTLKQPLYEQDIFMFHGSFT